MPPSLWGTGPPLSSLTQYEVGQDSPPIQQTLSPYQVRHAEA